MQCSKCGGKEINYNFPEGKIFCGFCGFLIEDNMVNQEISFGGKSTNKFFINGQFVRNSDQTLANKKYKFNEMIMSSAKRKINQLGNSLKLKTSQQNEAFRFFIFAIQRGFVQGHKLQNLCVACLYTVCRREKTPHLLIDFSDITQIQTNKIGAVFLKFIRTLNIDIPIVDPSLYVHRFISQLQFGNKSNCIIMSSLRLIARMKREWMSTGRRPTGLCGAAILLAARMHGIQKSQKEIGDIVRIGDIALRSRLREIDKTSMGHLTVKEIDFGGGDDGNNDSLFDITTNRIFDPPSLHKSFKKKKFDKNVYLKKNFENLNIKPVKKSITKKKNQGDLIKKTQFYARTILNKNIKINFFPDFNDIHVEMQNCISYLNSNYETYVKKNIWNEINSNYFCSHSIIIRAQKEKPFAYFRMGLKKNEIIKKK